MSTERLIAVKRRVEILLAGATPYAQDQFRAFLSWIEQGLGERQLQVIQFSDLGALQALISSGTLPRVFAVYCKKQATATASYFMEFDDTTDANTATRKRIQLPLLEASKEAHAIYPDGLLMANGVVIIATTAANGTTGSTSGDGPNGFIIIG